MSASHPVTIAAIMARQSVTVGREQTLAEAHDLMREGSLVVLPVLDRGALVGVVSRRDLDLLEPIVEPASLVVADAMTRDVCAVPPDELIERVVARMSDDELGCVVVMDAGEVVGVLTSMDALRFAVGGHLPRAGASRPPPAPRATGASPVGRWRESGARGYDLVVIVGSAGAIRPLLTILRALPPDYPLAVVVVQHRPSRPTDLLEPLLRRTTALPVVAVTDGARLEPGTVHLAPADLHVVARPGALLELHDGQRIAGVRSSANPLLESAAEALDGRVIAVILSGSGRDGTAGAQAVRTHGGAVIAQESTSAAFPGMPSSAHATGCVDFTLPEEEIAPTLLRLAGATPVPRAP
ncbi:MAG: chemotaxis protein CheB [Deltaproteobacteria bacterium]|nr:chemotaxis protein CheB [Myxococcales bacterium]MDP3219638.1 chemotaxis protein CheB [Deltaproteobacteria bacterium]